MGGVIRGFLLRALQPQAVECRFIEHVPQQIQNLVVEQERE